MSNIYVSGGGANLNYKVIGGTTQPTSPKVNTIWVNTSTAITSRIFSATQPTTPVAGMVWFQIGTSCSAPIDVLANNNAVMVYPVACQQYVSGKWVVKVAKTYQGSKWVDWNLVVFNGAWRDGYELKALTQGHSSTSKSTIDNSVNPVTAAIYQGQGGYIESVDVTDYNTLSVTFSVTGTGAEWFFIGLSTDTKWYDCVATNMPVYVRENWPATEHTVTLDVSSLSGEYYFKFYCWVGKDATFNLHNLTLER